VIGFSMGCMYACFLGGREGFWPSVVKTKVRMVKFKHFAGYKNGYFEGLTG